MDSSIKPIKLIPTIQQAEIPESKVSHNLPKSDGSLTLQTGKWQFIRGQLILNGRNVGTLLEQAVDQPAAFWNALANDLNVFLETTLRSSGKKRKKKKNLLDIDDEDELDPTGELSKLAGLVEAYIAKIMRLLKRKYDEKTDGLSFQLDEDGQLIVNGMNVSAFILMSRQYPSNKARLFLKGLKNRLGLILSNKSGNNNYEKIREVTERLFAEIDREIETTLKLESK